MPSTSQLTWNAALFYERAPLEVRLAADYVGQNLFAFGGITGNATGRVFAGAADDGFWQPVTRSRTTCSVYFDGKNLLNTPLEFTEGPSFSRPIQREFYDATVLAGVRIKFD